MTRIEGYCDCCSKSMPLQAKSVAGATRELERAWTPAMILMEPDGKPEYHIFCDVCAKALGLLLDCPGEAHEIIKLGGDQDHCMVCAPRWGLVPAYPTPILDWIDLLGAIRASNERSRQRKADQD
jgi:hypothetical protein